MPKHNSQVMRFSTGAVRGTDTQHERWDLITPIGLRRLAQTYAEGAQKYTPWNWAKGLPASNLICHAIRHIMLWLSGDRTEDHLAHATWNIMTLMHFEETRPDLIDIPFQYMSKQPQKTRKATTTRTTTTHPKRR